MNRKIYWLLGAGVAWVAYRAYYSYKNLKYRFTNVKFVKAQGSVVTLSVDFEIYNPTAITLNIGQLKAGLFLQNTQVGNIVYDCNTNMMSKAVSIYPITIEIDTQKVIKTSWDLLATSTLQQWTLTIAGSLQVEKKTIPVRFDYPLSKLTL